MIASIPNITCLPQTNSITLSPCTPDTARYHDRNGSMYTTYNSPKSPFSHTHTHTLYSLVHSLTHSDSTLPTVTTTAALTGSLLHIYTRHSLGNLHTRPCETYNSCSSRIIRAQNFTQITHNHIHTLTIHLSTLRRVIVAINMCLSPLDSLTYSVHYAERTEWFAFFVLLLQFLCMHYFLQLSLRCPLSSCF